MDHIPFQLLFWPVMNCSRTASSLGAIGVPIRRHVMRLAVLREASDGGSRRGKDGWIEGL